MPVLTRTLTINAAFLLEIKEDHRELRRLIDQTMAGLSPNSSEPASARTMADLLARLRDQFAMHFSLEEAFGYFEDAVTAAPRLTEQAELLRAEHETLFEQICAIADLAESMRTRHTSPRSLRRLALKFVAFHHQFQAHEAAENELILTAMDDDIGVGD